MRQNALTDRLSAASASTLLLTALILLVLYSLIMTVCTHGGYPIALGVSAFYLMVGLMHCLPYGQEARSAFYRLLRGVLWPTTVSFPEVLLADALTSISKVRACCVCVCPVCWAALGLCCLFA